MGNSAAEGTGLISQGGALFENSRFRVFKIVGDVKGQETRLTIKGRTWGGPKDTGTEIELLSGWASSAGGGRTPTPRA